MIRRVFLQAVVDLGGSPEADAALSRLDEAYGLQRTYHNLRHVEAVLETAKRLLPQGNAHVALALAYHDAVYDPRAKDNEERSAQMARDELSGLGISHGDLDEIARLILLTKHHQVAEGDVVGSVVVDADLAILQASPEEYDRYAAAIREEYAWVPEEEYRVGRAKVLEGLMSRKLFRSALLDEEMARANMRREIDRLEAS
jgi:predicted metal-dependent HD superfamily phosphohydrolase